VSALDQLKEREQINKRKNYGNNERKKKKSERKKKKRKRNCKKLETKFLELLELLT
jgi:hypothetical protein